MQTIIAAKVLAGAIIIIAGAVLVAGALAAGLSAQFFSSMVAVLIVWFMGFYLMIMGLSLLRRAIKEGEQL